MAKKANKSAKKTKTKLQKDSTNPIAFSPTPHMILWVDTAVILMSDSPQRIADESGIDRTSYYKWIKLPGFYDWYVEAYRSKRSRLIPQLDAIAMKHAKKGSYQHLEVLMRKAGDMPESKAPTNAIQINFDSKKYIKDR